MSIALNMWPVRLIPTTLTLPYLPMSELTAGGKTKKQMIRDYLENGDYSPAEISRLVGTSIENVYKEKSLFQRSGSRVVLTKSRKNSITTSPSGRQAVSKTEKVRLEVEVNNHISVPPLGVEELKGLYADFSAGQSVPEIISKRGLHPEAVEIEYRRYLGITQQDRPGLLKSIVDKVVAWGDSDTMDFSKARYVRTGFLSNSELEMVLGLNNNVQQRQGENALLRRITDSSSQLPDGWIRPACCVCRAPVPDIIVRESSYAHTDLAYANFSCFRHRP